jgi:peptidoglycan endopeptidase LytE
MMEQKNTGRARVKLAVYFVLAVHGIGLMALLMQGCRREDTTSQQADATNNVASQIPIFEPTNAAVLTDPVGAYAGNATNATQNTGIDPTQAQPPAQGSEYTIVAGDNYTKISTKFHVTVRALTDANPSVQPTRLRPGQKIHIPTPTVASAAPSPTATSNEATGGHQAYTVKSGDTLSKIATEHKTTVRAIRSANNLSTDRITVGQKLKIPASQASSPTTVATAPAVAPGLQ